jgi:competence ComEA-like helix-hairpin-helix protein
VNKREVIVLGFVIAILISMALVNFYRKERMRDKYALLVAQGVTMISLNTAEAREFEDLPGIGQVLARRIVDHREQVGGFDSLEQLRDVRGIGDKMYQKILPYIKL